ncbi:SGNH hydrolase domain-containing protein [Rhizobium oryzihabitans]|uniref:SGNH hydrolase domain-containing protein n=1 Tax=Rhizobium oryzihabitans TaxID=2267833 RepID=UPI004035EA0B
MHWPLIALYTYLTFRKPLPLEALAIGVASLVLGWFLYSFVELPFWKGRLSSWNGWSRATFMKAGAAALVLFPLLDMVRAGWPWRLPAGSRNVEQPTYGGEDYEANRIISLGRGQPRFIIAGDSHALQFAHGLDSLMKREGLGAIALFDHGCMIAPDLTRYGTTINDQEACTAEYQRLRQIMAEYPLPLVMAFNWPGYKTVIGPPGGEPLEFADEAAYWYFVAGKLRQIRQDAGERRFAIVGTVPGSGGAAAVADCLRRPLLAQRFCGAPVPKAVELASGYRFNLYLRRESSDMGLDYIDMYPLLCPEGRCISTRHGHDLYSDRSHLSKDGSEVAAAEILRYALREH